jgi:hypothetical protein
MEDQTRSMSGEVVDRIPTEARDVINTTIDTMKEEGDEALGNALGMTAAAVITHGMDEVAAGAEPTKVTIEGVEMNLVEALTFLAKKATDTEVKPVEKFDITKPRTIKDIPIELDKPRVLRLPFWALKKFQDATGINPWDHSKVWAYPPDMDALVALIWCGLLDQDPELKLEEVYRFPNMDFGNIHYLRYCLDECWGENHPKADPTGAIGSKATDPNSRPQAPIGSTIGPSRSTTSDSPSESSGA